MGTVENPIKLIRCENLCEFLVNSNVGANVTDLTFLCHHSGKVEAVRTHQLIFCGQVKKGLLNSFMDHPGGLCPSNPKSDITVSLDNVTAYTVRNIIRLLVTGEVHTDAQGMQDLIALKKMLQLDISIRILYKSSEETNLSQSSTLRPTLKTSQSAPENKTSGGKKLFKCRICAATFKLKVKLTQHMKEHCQSEVPLSHSQFPRVSLDRKDLETKTTIQAKRRNESKRSAKNKENLELSTVSLSQSQIPLIHIQSKEKKGQGKSSSNSPQPRLKKKISKKFEESEMLLNQSQLLQIVPCLKENDETAKSLEVPYATSATNCDGKAQKKRGPIRCVENELEQPHIQTLPNLERSKENNSGNMLTTSPSSAKSSQPRKKRSRGQDMQQIERLEVMSLTESQFFQMPADLDGGNDADKSPESTSFNESYSSDIPNERGMENSPGHLIIEEDPLRESDEPPDKQLKRRPYAITYDEDIAACSACFIVLHPKEMENHLLVCEEDVDLNSLV